MSKRSGIMLAKPFNASQVMKWPYIIAQPKLDGDRCKAICDGNRQVKLITSQGREITSLPHINGHLQAIINQPCILDGELYAPNISHAEIHGLASTKIGLPIGFSAIQYHIFDIITPLKQSDRIYDPILKTIGIAQTDFIIRVPNYIVNSLENLWNMAEDIIQDHEGLILRHPQAFYQEKRVSTMQKYKPRLTDYYQIVACRQEVSIHGEAKNALGAFVCINPEREEDNIFRIGSGPLLTRQARQEYWENREALLGQWLGVHYQYLTERGVPRGGSICFDIQSTKPTNL